MSNSSTQGLFCQAVVSGSFYWETDYLHHTDTNTMYDFLANHLPDGAYIHVHDGSYAEVEYDGRYYELHAGGNGDSFNHFIRWKQLL